MAHSRHSKSVKTVPTAIRCGIGYDIHPLVRGRKLILGGVRIPSETGLMGHSDADVLLHAICDALLGAANLGDIGRHFPNTDSAYRNISSLKLLQKVGRLLRQEGYAIVNIDSTVILEQPKILPYSRRMSTKISHALGIGAGQVSIKATTQEGIGFVGRGEGCAALAVASIILTSY